MVYEDNPSQARVVPFNEKESSESTVVVSNVEAESCKSHKDGGDDLSLIRKQLVQIENQQSSLLVLLQVGELAGIAVGATIMLNILIAGPGCGGSMNPVRTLGPAVAAGNYLGLWIYLVAPIVGALLDAAIYAAVKLKNDPNSPPRQVLVVTSQILLNILRHNIIKMEAIHLLILHECHHAVKKHPYSLVMSEFYHTTPTDKRPIAFGMTALPVNLIGDGHVH